MVPLRNWPAGQAQAEADVDDGGAVKPLGQLEHDAAPLAAHVLAAHGVHAVAEPPGDTEPAEHEEHALLLRYLPAGHDVTGGAPPHTFDGHDPPVNDW